MNIIQDKEKCKEDIIQDKEVLYKLHTILLSEPRRLLMLKSILLKEKVNNLGKALKILQSPTKTIPFLSPTHYKSI